ncbi:MAG: hypothetical protein U0414_11355 [Polyangiaceae bacterium]
MSREEELERKAEEIADDAIHGYEKIVPPHVLAEMRRILIADLLSTDEGRATLRACLDDPVVAKSDDIATGAPADDAIRKGKLGSGTP